MIILTTRDERAEIAIGHDQNPPRGPGDGEDILIGKAGRIGARDGLHVMATLAKVGNQPEVSALVEQEVHRAASDRAPFGGLWGNLLAGHQRLRVREAGLHVRPGQVRMGR